MDYDDDHDHYDDESLPKLEAEISGAHPTQVFLPGITFPSRLRSPYAGIAPVQMVGGPLAFGQLLAKPDADKKHDKMDKPH